MIDITIETRHLENNLRFFVYIPFFSSLVIILMRKWCTTFLKFDAHIIYKSIIECCATILQKMSKLTIVILKLPEKRIIALWDVALVDYLRRRATEIIIITFKIELRYEILEDIIFDMSKVSSEVFT